MLVRLLLSIKPYWLGDYTHLYTQLMWSAKPLALTSAGCPIAKLQTKHGLELYRD